MSRFTKTHRLEKPKGFTLAELAVVLVIVGLLLGGLMVPLSAQYDSRYINDTQKALNDIREALIGYAIVNGRLPCPADQSIQSATNNAGMEATTGSGATLTCACSTGTIARFGGTACTNASGVLPWATLGLPESDAWGNRFSYYVDSIFSRGINPDRSTAVSPKIWTKDATDHPCTFTPDYSGAPINSAFALCSYASISILTAFSGGATLASGIPAIVVSHGKSGAGAWTTSGNQIPGATGNEQENADGNAIFVSNTNMDDQLIWVSPNLLMNRMLTANKLP